jgi:hypothetical protein
MIKAALQSKYLWLIVSGDESQPPKPSDSLSEKGNAVEWKAEWKEYLDWMQRDQAAMGLMKGAMESSQLPHVHNSKSAKDMWDGLKKVHVTNQQSINVHYHFASLFTRKYTDGASMADHIASMLDLRYRITAAGEDLPDKYLAHALVLSLPTSQSWELIKIQIFGLEKDAFTVENVVSILQSEANRRLQEKSSGKTALYVQKQKKRQNGGKSKGPKPDDVCRKCGKKGHWALKCPENEAAKPASNANHVSNELRNLGKRTLGHVFMAVRDRPKSVAKTRVMLLDTGAFNHMFGNSDLLHNYKYASDTEVAATTATGNSSPAQGYGNVRFDAVIDGGLRTVVLGGVEHHPDFHANLVSLGTLQRQGATYRSTESGMTLFLDGEELFRATLLGSTSTLYRIETTSEEAHAAVGQSSGTLRLWRRRLGHLGIDAIREMQRKEMVEGMAISSTRDFDRVCEGCTLGKSHRLPSPKASTANYELMDVVAADLTGPMLSPTWTGMHYALVAVEVSTRKAFG